MNSQWYRRKKNLRKWFLVKIRFLINQSWRIHTGEQNSFIYVLFVRMYFTKIDAIIHTEKSVDHAFFYVDCIKSSVVQMLLYTTEK